MEEYPEELLTPPVPLVALLGVPQLHAQMAEFLASQQPAMAALSIPDPSDAGVLGGKERRPLDSRMPPPVGIIKSDWLAKHRQRTASVAVLLLEREHVYGDPTEWQVVCGHIDIIRNVIRGRGVKLLVLLLQATTVGEMNEERFVALRKRAEVEPRNVITFTYGDSADFKRSLNKMGNLLVEMVAVYYREEGRRVKSRVERKAYNHWELGVRYCFKMAVYAEFRRDWVSALRNYEAAYTSLQEGWVSQIISTPVQVQPVQSVAELKSVAEMLHLKVLTLLLHSGKETEAVQWFRRHVAFFREKVGPMEGAFMHWKWMARQLQVFGEMLQQRLATGQPPAPPAITITSTTITARELQPAFYFQLAAGHMLRWRRSFESALAALEAFGDADAVDVLEGPPDQVAPSLYIGQAPRLIDRGQSIHDQRPTENEYLRHELLSKQPQTPSLAVIEMQIRAQELFKDIHAVRSSYQLAFEMGREYFYARDYKNAKRLFDNVAGIYRKEAWPTLLAATLGYLRECARHLNLLTVYLQYSLELAALPTPDENQGSFPVMGPEMGPAGPLGELQHAVVCRELIGLLEGKTATLPAMEGTSGMTVTLENPVELTIGLQSPLRVAVTVVAAFEAQKVKLGEEVILQLALLSHLPEPVTLDKIDVHFSDSSLNCTLETGVDLTLKRGQWKRLSLPVIAGTSGRLSCLELVLRLSPYASFLCSIQSIQAVDSIPFWIFEPFSEKSPFGDPVLTMTGQSWVDIDEQEALVELFLESTDPALLGEALPVRIRVKSIGHVLKQGKLRLQVSSSDTSSSPDVPLSVAALAPPVSPVEASVVPVSPAEILLGFKNELTGDSDDSKDGGADGLSPSFTALLDLPTVDKDCSYNTVVYLWWKRPEGVSFTTTLSYTAENSLNVGMEKVEENEPKGEKPVGRSSHFQVSQSLTLSCREAFSTNVRYLGPFRKDALLPGGTLVDTKSSGGGGETSKPAAALPLNEMCSMVVCVKSTSPVPVRLLAVLIELDDKKTCQVAPTGGSVFDSGSGDLKDSSTSTWDMLGVEEVPGEEEVGGGLMLSDGEAFTRLFHITPLVESPALTVGRLHVRWERDSTELQNDGTTGSLHNSSNKNENVSLSKDSVSQVERSSVKEDRLWFEPVSTVVNLTPVVVESPPVVVKLHCPQYAVLGVPFILSVVVHNRSSSLLTIPFSVQDGPSFVFSGAHSGSYSVLPFTSYPLSYRLVPLTSGILQLPRIRLTVSQFNASLHPSTQSTKLFVYPSHPHAGLLPPKSIKSGLGNDG